MEPKLLCQELRTDQIEIDKDGMIAVPESPGLGIKFNTGTIKKYLVEVEIIVESKVLYRTPMV